jgi:hypothetical protein
MPAQKLDMNVSQAIDRLAELIAEGAGADMWEFIDKDDWHDPVLGMTAYRGCLWLGYADSYNPEQEADEVCTE